MFRFKDFFLLTLLFWGSSVQSYNPFSTSKLPITSNEQFSEQVSPVDLLPVLSSVDLKLEGEGLPIQVKRIQKPGFWSNNLFGSWELDMPVVHLPSGGERHDSYFEHTRDICSFFNKEDGFENDPFVIINGYKDKIVNFKGEIRTHSNKWKIECEIAANGEIEIRAITPNLSVIYFKAMDSIQIQVSFAIAGLFQTSPYGGKFADEAVETYTHLVFYPVLQKDSVGREISYTYNRHFDPNDRIKESPYFENGFIKGMDVCVRCVVLPDAINSDDGRKVEFEYAKLNTTYPVIEKIKYTAANETRTVSYDYDPSTSASQLAHYLREVKLDNGVVWTFVNDGPSKHYNVAKAGLRSRSSHFNQGFIPNLMYKPVSALNNNRGLSVEYRYEKSKCTGIYFNSDMPTMAVDNLHLRYAVQEKIVSHGDQSYKEEYYFYQPYPKEHYNYDYFPPCNKFPLNESNSLGNNLANRSIKKVGDDLFYFYFNTDSDSEFFGRLVAKGTKLSGWSEEKIEYYDWKSISTTYIPLNEPQDDKPEAAPVVIEEIRDEDKTVSYFYNAYDSFGNLAGYLLDDYVNPSIIRYENSSSNLAASQTVEIRNQYEYFEDYGFAQKKQATYLTDSTGYTSHFINYSRHFDENARLVSETKNGITSTFHYDLSGNIKYRDIGTQNTINISDPDNLPSNYADSILRTSYGEYHYGKAGKITHPDGTIEKFIYSPFGELTQHTDRHGKTIDYKYENGLLKAQLNNSDSYFDIVYEYEFGQPHGYTVTETHTENVDSTSTSGNTVKTTKYNGRNNPVSIVVARGFNRWEKSFEYDAEGRKTFESIVRPLGENIPGIIPGIKYVFDGLGRLTQRSTVSYRGEVIPEEIICYRESCASIDSNASTYGNFKIVKRRNGEVVYDFVSTLDKDYIYEKHVNPGSNQTLTLKYTYQANGMASDITIEDANVTKAVDLRYSPNTKRLHRYEDFETPTVNYSYYLNGEIKGISYLHPANFTMNKVFDKGVLDYISYGYSDTYVKEDYTYDTKNRIESIEVVKTEDVSGYKRSYTYDSDGKIDTETFSYPDSREYVIDYDFDALGALSAYTLPSNNKIELKRDSAQNLAYVNSGDLNLKLAYRAQNRLEDIGFGKNTDYPENWISFGFNDEYALSGASYTHKSSISYGDSNNTRLFGLDYKSNGLVDVYSDKKSNHDIAYVYDDFGRLETETGIASLTYNYQSHSDIDSVIRNGQTTDYTYENEEESKRLSKVGTQSIGYDLNGNIDSFNGKSLTFNSRNQLAQFTSGSRSSEFEYFAGGDRARELMNVGSSIVSDIRELRSTVTGTLLYTDDVIANRQEELIYVDGKLTAKRTICPDTDGDGLNDCHEDAIGFDKNIDNRTTDFDGDGFKDIYEITRGMNPLSSDSDEDGIPDNIDYNPNYYDPYDDWDDDGISNIDELTECGTNPLESDTDRDGMDDEYECWHNHLLDPTRNEHAFDDDNDGLNNYQEIFDYETNPFLADSDMDTLIDGFEVSIGLPPLYDNRGDYDADGIIDTDEVLVYGTNWEQSDTDGDRMQDGFEVEYGFNPLVKESEDFDGDGLWNEEEILQIGTDPRNADTDGDGLDDHMEAEALYTGPYQYVLDPLKNDLLRDYDYDGISNAIEIRFYEGRLDPTFNESYLDSDRDGVDDLSEIAIHLTDEYSEDTDQDGLNDHDELFIYFTNPREAENGKDFDLDGLPNKLEVESGSNPVVSENNGDVDLDGLPNDFELTNKELGADPYVNENNADFDLDGLSNTDELRMGYDPLNESSVVTGKSDYQVYIERVVVPVIINTTLL